MSVLPGPGCPTGACVLPTRLHYTHQQPGSQGNPLHSLFFPNLLLQAIHLSVIYKLGSLPRPRDIHLLLSPATELFAGSYEDQVIFKLSLNPWLHNISWEAADKSQMGLGPTPLKEPATL